jgi:segregation and condensation protein B
MPSKSAQLEAVLFQQAEPLTFTKLAKLLSWPVEEVRAAAGELSEILTNHGLILIENGEELALGTAPSVAPVLEQIAKAELAGPVGKAGLETLAIILYRGPISRPEIDYIRGVNSSFIIRHLLIRGLIKRSPKPSDNRTYVYESTVELLAHLGIDKKENLPRYGEIIKQTDDALAEISTDKNES